MTRRIRTILMALTILLAAVAMTSTAMAQDAAAPTTHDSPKGYTIAGPAGWDVVKGKLDSAELEKLPTNIREHYDPKTTDVMFMDLSTGKDNEFKDNLNVVVLDEPVPISDELINELKTILQDQYASLFESFALVSFEKVELGANQAIQISATYTLLGHNLMLYQVLLSNDAKALVVTCTMDQARKDERVKVCDEAFKSVAFK